MAGKGARSGGAEEDLTGAQDEDTVQDSRVVGSEIQAMAGGTDVPVIVRLVQLAFPQASQDARQDTGGGA